MSSLPQGYKVRIRLSVESDISPIAENMREADRAEVMASHGHLPEAALRVGLEDPLKECYTVTADGVPIAMFGCTLTPFAFLAGVWFLGTPATENYIRDFLTLPPLFFEKWMRTWPHLFNIVDKRNVRSLRWLKKLGFKEIAESDGWTNEKTPFVMVVLSRGDRKCVNLPQ